MNYRTAYERAQDRLHQVVEKAEAQKAARLATYLTAGELCERAGITQDCLDLLRRARLLNADRGGLFRPKLTGWAVKLGALLRDEWTIEEIKRWSVGRWKTENPRRWPPDRDEWRGQE